MEVGKGPGLGAGVFPASEEPTPDSGSSAPTTPTAPPTNTPTPTSVNLPPVLDVGASSRTVVHGAPLAFVVLASDPEAYTVTSTCTLGTGTTLCTSLGATFQPTSGEFSWTPTLGQAGVQVLRFQASDGVNSVSSDVTVTVTNSAPVLASIPSAVVPTDTLMSFSLSASDADSDPLTYSCVTNCTGFAVNASSGAVTWTPGSGDLGSRSVTFQASDGVESHQQSASLTVFEKAAPLVWKSSALTVSATGSRATLAEATGGLGTTLHFSVADATGLGRGSLQMEADSGERSAFQLDAGWIYSSPLADNIMAGRSDTERGQDTGELNAPAPNGIGNGLKDLTVAAPWNNDQTGSLVSFEVPFDGNYTVSELAIRRVKIFTADAIVKVLRPDLGLVATLSTNSAQSNRAWVSDTPGASYTLSGLKAGERIHFLTILSAVNSAVEASTELHFSIGSAPVSNVLTSKGTFAATSRTGAQTTMSVVLGRAPAANVTVPLVSSNETAGGTVSPASVTFTPANWQTPQMFTVTGAAGGPVSGFSEYAVSIGLAQSTDASYLGSQPPSNSWALKNHAVLATAGTWNIVHSSTGSKGTLAFGSHTADVEYFVSSGLDSIAVNYAFDTYHIGAHPDAFNSLIGYWDSLADDNYPYVAKSSEARGNGAGETNVPAPAGTGVFDLQMHPPDTDDLTVAAFVVPAAGDYTVSGIGIRIVSPSSEGTSLHVFGPDGVRRRVLSSTMGNQTAWNLGENVTFTGLQTGDKIYLGIDSEGNFAYDATEITATFTRAP